MSDESALLMTDIVGSTGMNSRLGDEHMNAVWAAHDRLTRGLIRQHGGREIGRADGFIVVFGNVDAAFRLAVAYHRALETLSPPLQARVGIHFGALSLRENTSEDRTLGATPFEADGVALPIAARLMGAADGGQSLSSAAACRALSIPDNFRLVGHGHWQFKGVDGPIEIFEVGDDSTLFHPPSDSEKAYRVVQQFGIWVPVAKIPHALPAERDVFVGRQAWLQRLGYTLGEEHARLVTVLGPGGVGKTRVVLRYAITRLAEYPGGTWFCDLSFASTEEGIVHSVGQGLGIQLGTSDPVGQIGLSIAARGNCLVILDNFEQVAMHAEATLGTWLAQAPAAQFIATSREVLGISGEVVNDLEPLEAEEAVALFQRRVRESASPAGASVAVRQLVELLDRLPLAIELAAARAQIMSPEDLLRGMSDRFRLLARRTGRSERQLTMRATMDWSWALLASTERAAAGHLSVFEGGFTLGTAQDVVELDCDSNQGWISDVLQALVEKSIVRRVTGQRFEMLRTVQDYSSAYLRGKAGEFDAALRRHWRHFAALDENVVTNRRCDDIENIVAAARRAAAAEDADCAARALVVAAAVLQQVGPISVILSLAQEVSACPGLSPSQRASTSRVSGNALYSLGRRPEAMRAYELGLEQAHVARDRRLVARLSCALAEPLMRAGDRSAAQRHIETARDAVADDEDAGLHFIVLNTQGALHLAAARLDEARVSFEKALAITRDLGHRRREGGVLSNLGNVLYTMSQAHDAAACFVQAIAIGEEVGDRRWAANARCNLGLIYGEEGRGALAVRELQICIDTAREIGYSSLEATALCNLGQALLASDATVATQNLAHAMTIAERLDDRALALHCSKLLAQAYAKLGRHREALCILQHALRLAEQASDVLEIEALQQELSGDTTR